MASQMSYDEATAKFEGYLSVDDDQPLTSLAKELLQGTNADLKGAACLAIAKLRLKSELMLHGPSSNAFPPAEEALKYFQESENKKGEARVLNVLAQASLVAGESQMAVLKAKEAQRLANSLGELKLAADAFDTLFQAHSSVGDKTKALSAAKERVDVLRKLDDKKTLASMLTTVSNLQLEKGLKEAATKSAEEASYLLKASGDMEAERKAQQSLSRALVQSGKVDQAPTRSKALAALERVASAVERRNEEDYQRAMYDLDETGGCTDKDVKDKLNPIIAKDEEGVMKFLRKMRAPWLAKGQATKISEFTKVFFYLGFRTGGIQYGPRYQCVTAYRQGEAVVGNALSVLQPCEQSDTWEINLGYHTGILDGALQTGAVIGVPKPY